MNKFISYVMAMMFVIFANITFAGETATLKPEAWNEMDIKIVQGDIPEIQAIANQATLPLPQHPNATVDTAALAMWDGGESWANLVLGSLVGTVVIFTLFTIVNGPVKLSKGFSGVKIPRWSKADIIFHWVGAISCLSLIVTGILIASGRFLIADNMGADNWGAFIQNTVSTHNLMSFPFIFGWAIMVIKWAKKQFPEQGDLNWFKSLGGYINFGPLKGRHPDAGFANAGEKLWFWCFTLFGGVLVVTGLSMMFPALFEFAKGTMNWMLLMHCVSAAIIGVFTVVHVFMATIISEGGMEGMVSGYCDENWAKEHHNLWYRDQKKAGKV